MDPLVIGYILGFAIVACVAAFASPPSSSTSPILPLGKGAFSLQLSVRLNGTLSPVKGKSLMTQATVTQTIAYLVVPFDQFGNPTQFGGPLTWTSSDTGIATVNPSLPGNASLTLTGRAGTLTISVTDGIRSASDTVTLLGGPATRLQLTILVDGVPPVDTIPIDPTPSA